MAENLLPCPFCGGEAELHCNSDETLYGVYCPSCGAQTAHEGFATDQEAVAAWNRRPEPVNEPIGLRDNENFIQTKFGYCFYCLEGQPLIYNLYTHQKYRRSGHAKRLIRQVISEIRRAGYNCQIGVEVSPRENSIPPKALLKFYENMGLEIKEPPADSHVMQRFTKRY